MNEKDAIYQGTQYISSPLELEHKIKSICKDSIDYFNILIRNHTRKESLLKTVSYIKYKHNLSAPLDNIDDEELGFAIFVLCASSYRYAFCYEIMTFILQFFKNYMPSETSRLEQLYSRQSS